MCLGAFHFLIYLFIQYLNIILLYLNWSNLTKKYSVYNDTISYYITTLTEIPEKEYLSTEESWYFFYRHFFIEQGIASLFS